ncbi:tetratricopeptide repeat protein [Chloroflexota bacterium]
MKKFFSLLLISLALPLVLSSCIGLSEADKHFSAGWKHQEQGRLQEAIVDYGEAIRIYPQDAVVYYKRDTSYSPLGQYKQASEDFDEAICLTKDAVVYYNRGMAYFPLGQYERAIEDFDEAIRLNPQFADAYFTRGNAYKLQGKISEAIANFEKFITLVDNPWEIEEAVKEIKRIKTLSK